MSINNNSNFLDYITNPLVNHVIDQKTDAECRKVSHIAKCIFAALTAVAVSVTLIAIVVAISSATLAPAAIAGTIALVSLATAIIFGHITTRFAKIAGGGGTGGGGSGTTAPAYPYASAFFSAESKPLFNVRHESARSPFEPTAKCAQKSANLSYNTTDEALKAIRAASSSNLNKLLTHFSPEVKQNEKVALECIQNALSSNLIDVVTSLAPINHPSVALAAIKQVTYSNLNKLLTHFSPAVKQNEKVALECIQNALSSNLIDVVTSLAPIHHPSVALAAIKQVTSSNLNKLLPYFSPAVKQNEKVALECIKNALSSNLIDMVTSLAPINHPSVALAAIKHSTSSNIKKLLPHFSPEVKQNKEVTWECLCKHNNAHSSYFSQTGNSDFNANHSQGFNPYSHCNPFNPFGSYNFNANHSQGFSNSHSFSPVPPTKSNWICPEELKDDTSIEAEAIKRILKTNHNCFFPLTDRTFLINGQRKVTKQEVSAVVCMMLDIYPLSQDEEISKAFKMMALKIHPDKCKLEAANKAFSILSAGYNRVINS